MKYAIAVIIIVGLVGGLWYGFGTWRRQQMLDSGRPVLLVNTKAAAYTYSDLVERDDITSDYKIIGYADELSSADVALLTQGMNLVVGVETQPGDPRIISMPLTSLQIPSQSEQQSWAAVVAQLSQQVKTLCSSIQDAATVQQCFATHVIQNAVTTKQPKSFCASLYVLEQKADCEKAIDTGSIYVDADADALIDFFEEQAIPPDQRVNSRNLPIINPIE